MTCLLRSDNSFALSILSYVIWCFRADSQVSLRVVLMLLIGASLLYDCSWLFLTYDDWFNDESVEKGLVWHKIFKLRLFVWITSCCNLLFKLVALIGLHGAREVTTQEQQPLLEVAPRVPLKTMIIE